MARHRSSDLKRGKIETRPYRDVCWVSAEGRTERDYFSMDVFREAGVSIRFPRDIHPDRRNPGQVLKRFQKALREHDFRPRDEAWLVVDVDEWDAQELQTLTQWEKSDERHHLAVSNPKFELFLLMHFEKGSGCTTASKVDAALRRHLPRYDKRLGRGQFSRDDVERAIAYARTKCASQMDVLPEPGMTGAHLLAERLLAAAPRR